MAPLTPNSLIVVTGLTSYVGSYVGLPVIQEGHRLRGTVRSEQKAKEIREVYEKQGVDPSKLEIVVIDNLADRSQYERAFDGADGVIQVALDSGKKDMVQYAIDSTTALLEAAQAKGLKRVVFCSSLIAATSLMATTPTPLTGTASEWNHQAIDAYDRMPKEELQANFWVMYAATKTLSEKAAWKWVEDNKPSFDFVSTIPGSVFGPVLYGDHPTTSEFLWKLLHNDDSYAKMVPAHWYVDARDNARVHVRALTDGTVAGRRIWVAAEPHGWNQLMAIFRKNIKDANVPDDVPGEQGAINTRILIDNSLATMLVGIWTPLEQSVVETAKAWGFELV